MGRGIALPFHDRGTRRGWVVSSTPRPHFTPGKDPVPILQEAGWTPGSVWTGGKSRHHRDSIPDRPARSQSLYQQSYRPTLLWSVIFNLSSFLSGSVWDGRIICRLVFGSLWYVLEFLQETLENRHFFFFFYVFFLLPPLKRLNRLNMKFESPVLGTSY